MRRFCDGAVCAGYLLSIGESELHNRVQEEVAQAGEALITVFEGGRDRLGELLLHGHPWVEYYAACCLLKCNHTDPGAVKTLERLATMDDWVAPKSEVTLYALRNPGASAGRQ